MFIPEPFTLRGKLLYLINILMIILILVIGAYLYLILPDEVPTHFNVGGMPDAYGSKLTFILVSLILTIGPIIIVLITKFRFTLLNNHPYLINIPSFYTKLPRLPLEQRSKWINRYFEAILALGLLLSIDFLILLYGIYFGSAIGKLPWWFAPTCILSIVLIIIPFITYLYYLSKSLEKELNRY